MASTGPQCKIQSNGGFYTFSCLEINNGQMESLDASDVKLFAEVTLK